MIRPRTLPSLLLCGGLVLLAAGPVRAEETLQQALIKAYQTNPGLQAERAKLRAVDEKVPEAMSGFRPSIEALADVGAASQESKDQGIKTSKDLNPRSVGLQVVQPVFQGFRTQASIKAADKDVLMARAQMTAFEQSLLYETGDVFLRIVQESAVLDLLDNHEKLLEEQFAQARDRLAAGISTQTDVLQAESRLEKVRADKIQVEGDLDSARAAYTRILGQAPTDLEPPNLLLDKPAALEEAIEQAETRNPRVEAARHAVDKARAGIDQSRGSLLPEVNLVGTTGRSWEQSLIAPGRTDSSQIMLQLRVPLYKGGADYAKTRAAQETTVQNRLEMESARRDAHELAVRGWKALMTAQAAIKARQTAIRAAAQALEGVQEEQKAGTRTTIDVLNAQQELLDARVGLVRARHDKDLAVLQIKAAVGGLTIEALGLSPDLYRPEAHYNDVRGKWAGFSKSDPPLPASQKP